MELLLDEASVTHVVLRATRNDRRQLQLLRGWGVLSGRVVKAR